MKKQEDIWNSLYSSGLSWKLESDIPNICKNKIVLELGAGNGKSLASIMNQKPKEVYAIDFSDAAVDICQKKFKNKNIFIEKADATSLPYEDSTFNVVICNFILDNIADKDLSKLAAELHRVLKRQGKVFFSDFSKGDYRENSFVKDFSEQGRYCKFFTIEEIGKIFKDFKTINLDIIESFPIRTDKSKKRRIITGLFKKS